MMNRSMPLRRRPLVLAVSGAVLSILGGCGGSVTEAEVEALEEAQASAITIQSHGPNAVSVWDEIAFNTISVGPSPAGTTPSERVAGPDIATVHLAIYDAVIAIAGTHRPFAIRPATSGQGGGQVAMDAAAIEAAYRALKGLFPSRGDKYEAAYAAGIAALPDGDAKTRGMAIGAEVAAGMLALRANDGREIELHPYVAGTLPGQFRPSNPNLVGRLNQYIKPFTTTSHAQFRAGPPPALDSALYASDLNEVKAIASTTSAVRTAEQTDVARFFTEPPPPWQFRNRGRFTTASPNLADNARITAMLAVAGADALGACFETKYHYNYWRPTSAIRLADTDGNPATGADAGWTPFVTTPNHPEYPAAQPARCGTVSSNAGRGRRPMAEQRLPHPHWILGISSPFVAVRACCAAQPA